MGQIIGSAAKPKRCNLNKLSQLGTPAAGEYILVSSDNSMNAAGQGSFDCYIIGDGQKMASELNIVPLDDKILSLLPDDVAVFENPVIAQSDIYIRHDGTTRTGSKWHISAPIALKKGETLSSYGYGDNAAWLSYATPIDGKYEVLVENTAFQAPFSWTAPKDCEVVISGYGDIFKYSISQDKQSVSPIQAWDAVKEIVSPEIDVVLLEGKRIIGLNDEQLGNMTPDSNYIATDYIDVEGNDIINVSVCGAVASSNSYGVAFYDENKIAITNSGMTFFGESENNNDVRAIVVPSGAKYMRTTIWKNIGTFQCYVVNTSLLAEGMRKISLYDAQIKKVDEKVDSVYAFREGALANSYFNGIRLVDTMTNQLWGKSTDTKVGTFTPVSATADTITLSSDDAACIANIVILSCKLQNGNYRNIYFSAASINVITKLYDFGENIDCQNIVSMQSLHDTINGASGIHLSPYGYRAMAHTLYNKLSGRYVFSNVCVGGWSAQFCKAPSAWNDPLIYDSYGNLVCSPKLTGITVGGAFNRCALVYAGNVAANTGPYYRTYYEIAQSAPNGASVSFMLTPKYPFKGFLMINCARQLGNDGTASLVVKDGEGNMVATRSIAYYADSYVVDLNEKYYDGIEVVIEMPDNTNTKVMITRMTLHETYVNDVQLRGLTSKSSVALLGSSNTMFPHLEDAEILCPDDPDNVLVVRPDETTGDGCGYFGKELERVSGASVDNWGKSGEQTPYGLSIIQKVFEHKRYTHVILSFFANDINANRPMAETLTNIRQMAEYVRGHGAIPVVIMGYASNANGFIRYSLMYDDLTQGFDSPFIYTSGEIH